MQLTSTLGNTWARRQGSKDTILKTNLDAIPEIVRQIRLRYLGGIIVIDFIDMDERKNRFKVMAALEEALKNDRAPTKVLQFNDFGLVAITRKRVKQSLERTLSVPCPTCQATGMVKSPTTVCNEIFTELRKMKKHFEGADVLLRVNPETVKVLKANNASWITEFEELIGKNILIKSDATLHPPSNSTFRAEPSFPINNNGRSDAPAIVIFPSCSPRFFALLHCCAACVQTSRTRIILFCA